MKNVIIVGTEVNSNTGEFVRSAFIKTQENFNILYNKKDILTDECFLDVLIMPCNQNE